MASGGRIPSPLPSPSGGLAGTPIAQLFGSRLPTANGRESPGNITPGGLERQSSVGNSPLLTVGSSLSASSKAQQLAHDVRDLSCDDLAQAGDRIRRSSNCSSSSSSLTALPKMLPPAPTSGGRPPPATSTSMRQRDSAQQPTTPRMQTFLSMHGLAPTAIKSPIATSAPTSRIASGGTSPIPSTPVNMLASSSSAFSLGPRDSILASTPNMAPMSAAEDRGLRTSSVASAGLQPSTASSGIMVTVRIRPLSDKERQRGDHEAWGLDANGNVGQYDRAGKLVPKYHYDTVFGPQASNREVYECVAAPLVQPALDGINGTVFAYGVTSSGKTHTMLGTDADPGILPSVILNVFAQKNAMIAAQQAQGQQPVSFCVRLSMMEIYNEVLNDLLDPTRTNLKVMEDASRGVMVVEGLAEEPVASASAALAAVSRGELHRKVGCTAMNEDSSRSHTLCRLIIEASRPAGSGTGGAAASAGFGAAGAPLSVTTAALCLIDLAGSESARVTLSRGQRMEGAYINKSLLTLGTVIHKLAAGHASHVPFRDSKLTRLLQSSMSGPGARIAIVCNITPAAAQAEETANTLKFATRAKLVRVSISRNEVLDDAVLVRLYRSEILELKRQVAALLSTQGLTPSASLALPDASYASSEPGSSTPVGSGLAPEADMAAEVRSLQQQLERERQTRVHLEQEKAMLEQRLRGLTHLMLNDSRALAAASTPQGRRGSSGGSGGRLSPGSQLPSAPLARISSQKAMRRSDSNIPAHEGSTTSASASGTPDEALQHRRSRSDLGPQPEANTPSPASLPRRVSVLENAAETAAAAGGSKAADGGAEGGAAAGGAGPSSASQRTAAEQGAAEAGGDEGDAESEALLSTIMAMQEELNDASNAVPDRISAHSETERHSQQRLSGRPPLSQSTGGSPRPSPVAAAAGQYVVDMLGLHTASSSVLGDNDKDLEIQVLLADREVLQDQIIQVELHNEQLSHDNETLRMDVQTLQLEREKARRMLRELEGDMIALRSFKNQTHAQLEALGRENTQLQAALAAKAGGVNGVGPSGSTGVNGSHAAVAGWGGDAAMLPALQQQLQQLGTGGALTELRAVNPGVYLKLERLEQQILSAINGTVAHNQQLETTVTALQRDKQALLEAAATAAAVAGAVAGGSRRSSMQQDGGNMPNGAAYHR